MDVRLTSGQNTILRTISSFNDQENQLINDYYSRYRNMTSTSSSSTNDSSVSVDIPSGFLNPKKDVPGNAFGLQRRSEIFNLIKSQNERYGSTQQSTDLLSSLYGTNDEKEFGRFAAKLTALYTQRELAYNVLSMTLESKRQILQLFR
jgi:hypothetical protein